MKNEEKNGYIYFDGYINNKRVIIAKSSYSEKNNILVRIIQRIRDFFRRD